MLAAPMIGAMSRRGGHAGRNVRIPTRPPTAYRQSAWSLCLSLSVSISPSSDSARYDKWLGSDEVHDR